MHLPFFYLSDHEPSLQRLILNEETSKYIVQVLRMKNGDMLQLTDGKGSLLTCEIIDDHKRKCTVRITGSEFITRPPCKTSIAISLLKNASRFEWFLEKATEVGISEIIPLICNRTERQKFRFDRMKNILISAMLQSQQHWLPELKEAVSVQIVIQEADHQQKFIAHCQEQVKIALTDAIVRGAESHVILIGPEGDFTSEEVDFALQHHFISVKLGDTRLRSETAGLVAATILKIA